MKRVRANASWNKLTPKQRETLDRWLVEEKLSYVEAWTRAKNELGYKGSKTSLHRYSVRRESERILTKFLDVREQVAAVNGAPVDEKSLRRAGMKLLGEFLFQQVREHPEKVKEWAMVAGLIVDNDRNELLRELKGEELKLRQQVFAFAREKFQFDIARRALKALPQLQELAEAKKDPAAKGYEENIGFNRVIRRIFGPLAEVEPESDQEAMEMLAAIRERKARQEAESECLRRREELNSLQPPPPSSQYYKEYMEAKAEFEAGRQGMQKTFQESRAQAAVMPDTEKADRDKLRQQREAQAAEAKQAEQEALRKQQAIQKRFEELREICGWQEVPRPPGLEEG